MSSESKKYGNSVFKYNPQLDGLRFCAVLTIVCFHWLPIFHQVFFIDFLGDVVNFFFVLSSYLITRILLIVKERSVEMGVSKFKVIAVFLVRRTLRIFPAYYFFLIFIMYIPQVGAEVLNNAGMYFSYLSNFHIFQSQSYHYATGHLWTLAIEEQFYIVWPFIILFIPGRHLLKTFLLIIVASVGLRAIFYYPAEGVSLDVLTPFCVDAFAVGGILAYKYNVPASQRLLISKYFKITLLIGIPVGIVVFLTESLYFSFIINKLLIAMVSMVIVEGAVVGYRSVIGNFLQNRFVLYLGKISYGIYLYHLLVPVLFWKVYKDIYEYIKLNHNYSFTKYQYMIEGLERTLTHEAVYFLIYSVLVVALAAASWKLIEWPIMKMKISFKYTERDQVRAAVCEKEKDLVV